MINQTAVAPDMPGGTRHYDFGIELVQRFGCDVTIFASDFNYTTRKRTRPDISALQFMENYNGVNFVWVRTLPYKTNDWRRILNMLSFAFNVHINQVDRKKPNIIVGSTPSLFAAFAGYMFSRRYECKFVLEVRDLWPQALIDMGTCASDSLTVKFLKLIERFLYKRADQIVVFAEGSKKYISDLNSDIDPEKILFIPNGVHLDHFKPSEARDRVRQKLKFGDKLIVMYAGAHGLINALHTIIETADLLRYQEGIEFVLVGDGPSKLHLLKLVEEKGLSNIRFFDPVSKHEIPNVLNAADILVITLKDIKLCSYSVSPNKLFDYMAIGKPILCAVGGDIASIVHESSAGLLIPPENHKALAEAVINLHNSPEKREDFGENGQHFLSKHFSRQVLVEQFYKQIIEQ